MKSSCHKGIVIRRIAEYYKLCAAYGIIICSKLCGMLDNISHESYRIHIYACLGRADIYRRAYIIGLTKCLRNRFNKQSLCLGHALVDQGGISAQKVDAYLLCRPVQSLRYSHKVLGSLAGFTSYQGYRRNRNSLVDYRYAEVLGYVLSCLNQIPAKSRYLAVNVVVQLIEIRIDAV